jgi:hypothetical protein
VRRALTRSIDAAVMIGQNWRLALLCGFYTVSITCVPLSARL